jgi:AcrR family transcriptional regulator
MERRSGTEEKIVQTALEMFNENGIEYVGMRELAAKLGMRIGNLTYYFPTKDDLVNRLSLDLADANNQTIIAVDQLTMRAFFRMLEDVFRNHLQYRCLLLSFVHIMERNPLIAKRYGKVQSKRNETWKVNILALQKNGYLATKNQAELAFLVSAIALIARFWISEAAISYKSLAEEGQRHHYLNMIARIFLPYATPRGKRELEPYFSNLMQ